MLATALNWQISRIGWKVPRRNPDCAVSGWYVVQNHGVGADLAAIADCQVTNDLRTRPDVDVVADHDLSAADCHSLAHQRATSDRGALSHHRAEAVVQVEAGADGGGWREIRVRRQFGQAVHDPGNGTHSV